MNEMVAKMVRINFPGVLDDENNSSIIDITGRVLEESLSKDSLSNVSKWRKNVLSNVRKMATFSEKNLKRSLNCNINMDNCKLFRYQLQLKIVLNVVEECILTAGLFNTSLEYQLHEEAPSWESNSILLTLGRQWKTKLTELMIAVKRLEKEYQRIDKNT